MEPRLKFPDPSTERADFVFDPRTPLFDLETVPPLRSVTLWRRRQLPCCTRMQRRSRETTDFDKARRHLRRLSCLYLSVPMEQVAQIPPDSPPQVLGAHASRNCACTLHIPSPCCADHSQ